MRHQVIFEGGDQTLYHVPRDRYGRVSIPEAGSTYSIVALWRSDTDDERVVQESAPATTSSATEALTASAGPGTGDAKLLTVADSTGFVAGRQYLLSEGILSELVTVESVAPTQIRLQHTLRNDYTTSASIDGVELEATFPEAAAEDEDDLEAGGGPYGVIWSYTIGGIDFHQLEEAWVSRYTTSPLITEADVLRAYPQANDLARERWTVIDAIAAASEDFTARLEASGRRLDLFRHGVVTTVSVRLKALSYLKRWAGKDEDAEILDQEYIRMTNDLVTGQYPERTVKINDRTDTAQQRGDRGSGEPRFRVS